MHDHAGVTGIRAASSRRLLSLSLAITATVMVVLAIGAVVSGSLALLADAAHMFADTAALVIALVASVVAARPANDRRTFGYQRAEVFGALLNSAILIALCVWITVEAIQRLVDPGDVEIAGGIMLAVAVLGLVANAVAMWLLSAAQRTSINVRGAYLEVMGDALGSIAVIVAAIILLATGWTQVDAVASLVVAALIAPRAIKLLTEAMSVLAESAPTGVEIQTIRDHILGTDDVVDVHDVHVWQLTRGSPVFSAHVVVTERGLHPDRQGALLAELQTCLDDHFDVEHSTFQLEPAGHVEHDPHD